MHFIFSLTLSMWISLYFTPGLLPLSIPPPHSPAPAPKPTQTHPFLAMYVMQVFEQIAHCIFNLIVFDLQACGAHPLL